MGKTRKRPRNKDSQQKSITKTISKRQSAKNDQQNQSQEQTIKTNQKTEMNCPPLHSGNPSLYLILLFSLLHPHFTQTPFCHQVFHTDFLHPIIIRLSQRTSAYSPHRSSITSATVSIFSHCHALYPQKSKASSIWPLAARISARLMQ